MHSAPERDATSGADESAAGTDAPRADVSGGDNDGVDFILLVTEYNDIHMTRVSDSDNDSSSSDSDSDTDNESTSENDSDSDTDTESYHDSDSETTTDSPSESGSSDSDTDNDETMAVMCDAWDSDYDEIEGGGFPCSNDAEFWCTKCRMPLCAERHARLCGGVVCRDARTSVTVLCESCQDTVSLCAGEDSPGVDCLAFGCCPNCGPFDNLDEAEKNVFCGCCVQAARQRASTGCENLYRYLAARGRCGTNVPQHQATKPQR